MIRFSLSKLHMVPLVSDKEEIFCENDLCLFILRVFGMNRKIYTFLSH
jgi:hypothetical protein